MKLISPFEMNGTKRGTRFTDKFRTNSLTPRDECLLRDDATFVDELD